MKTNKMTEGRINWIQGMVGYCLFISIYNPLAMTNRFMAL